MNFSSKIPVMLFIESNNILLQEKTKVQGNKSRFLSRLISYLKTLWFLTGREVQECTEQNNK